MLNAILLLETKAKDARSVVARASNRITKPACTAAEYAAAHENAKLAAEYAFAARALRKLHDDWAKKGIRPQLQEN